MYLFGLFRVVEEPALATGGDGLGTLPDFHPHVARYLHALTQLTCTRTQGVHVPYMYEYLLV